MPYEFKFPDVGEGITEGTLIKWLVKEGDQVKEDTVLAEVETDKAIVEIPSPVKGKVLKLHAKPKDKIKVGAVLVTFETVGPVKEQKKEVIVEKEKPKVCPPEKSGVAIPKSLEAALARIQAQKAAASIPQPQIRAVSQAAQETRTIAEEATAKAVQNDLMRNRIQNTGITRRIIATPHTRQLARDLKIDIETIQGSGPQGRVTDDDVRATGSGTQASLKQTQTEAPMPPPSSYEKTGATEITATKIQDNYGPTHRKPLAGIRKAIADKMVESVRHAVHVTHCDEADITDLVKVREKEKAAALKKGIKLTFLPFIAKAAIAALKKFPQLNASIDEATNEIVYKEYHHLGMALATEFGLIVPVIKDADQKSILELAEEMHELADRGRVRKLKPEEMKGSSFTITNVGSIGGTVFTPIINYPEVAILGIGRIRELPRIIDGKVQSRSVLYLSLSFDHRIADGAIAAQFMNEIITHLEDPDLLLVDTI